MSEHDKLAEAREALERITDYFDQRADAEAVGDPARYQGNREMYLRRDAETVAAALASARAEGAAEAFERAAKVCEDFNRGDQPPGWDADLFDECELKEDAYDAGLARGAWAGHSADAAAIRALAKEAAE